jgi:hypothetical protein
MKDLTKLTSREIASIKRIFLNNLPMYKKMETINKKIEELNNELNDINTFIESSEAGVKNLTGYTSGELISCEYIPQFNEDGTPKMDKEGKYQQKKRVLTFVIPVQEQTNDNTEKIMDPEFENENDLKSEEEVFPDNLNNVENV